MNKISTVEAKQNFSDLINDVSYGNKDYVLTRHGKDIAVITSIKKWKYLEKLMNKVKILD